MIISERELKPFVLNPPSNITRVRDAATEEKLFAFLEENKDHGFDVETNMAPDFFWRRMRTMQFGTSKEQYVIDLKQYCDNSSDILYNCQGNYGRDLNKAPRLQALLEKLKKYLCSSEWTKTGVNLGFEYECLYWQFGIRAYGWYDCMIAEKCIYAGLGGHASLKNYDFYSMESLMERYFGVSIDKTLQTSFNLEDDITDAQFEYAALDTRTPLAIKMLQNIIASGETPSSLKAKGKPVLAGYLNYLDSIIFGDNLHEIIGIENEAIGSFIDMHVHGERIDREPWKERVQKAKDKLVINISGLDKIFVPIVGSKFEAIDETLIAKLDAEWKTLRDTPTEREVALKVEMSALKRWLKKNPLLFDGVIENTKKLEELQKEFDTWEGARKEQKEILKKKCSETSKKLTKIRNLKDKCEGEALINYGSDAQLLKVLTDVENWKYFPQLFNKNKKPLIESLEDETLEEFEHCPAIKLIREYHGLSKEIGTYGDSWATEWVTKPGGDVSAGEGWLHPGDGRLHPNYNQLDAATGRSSSSQPNGQNLPQDKTIRGCFIADPLDESIRISNCCEEESQWSFEGDCYYCAKCGEICSTHAEEYVIVTADMSGAELRIIAEAANDPVWISAFARGEDVHSVGTELLYEIEWPKESLPDCAYYKLKENGEPARHKCNCPMHKERRDHNKATNFLLAYGGGPTTLAARIKKKVKEAKQLMALHEQKNPNIWAYLDKSGKDAAMNFKAFDLFGRRRLLPEPTRERAVENCKEYNEKDLRLSDEECQKNINAFLTIKGRKPNKDEEFECTHRQPIANEVSRSFFQLSNSISRQGKNHAIQGTNATIAKKAMGAGYDKEGKPFLFHTLHVYKAKLIKFVHDELVVQCPKRYGNKVADLIGDAFKRAAALRMKKVVMEFDFNIASYWKK